MGRCELNKGITVCCCEIFGKKDILQILQNSHYNPHLDVNGPLETHFSGKWLTDDAELECKVQTRLRQQIASFYLAVLKVLTQDGIGVPVFMEIVLRNKRERKCIFILVFKFVSQYFFFTKYPCVTYWLPLIHHIYSY